MFRRTLLTGSTCFGAIFGAGREPITGSGDPDCSNEVTSDLVDLIPLYAPAAAIRQKLLVDNPARLFKFANQASIG
jgi:hypothetical protein